MTSTAPIFDAYTAEVNTPESTAVVLKQTSWVPLPDQQSVKERIAGAAEEMKVLAEEAEKTHTEYFAGYYIYEMDQSSNTYSIGVYGNQLAAASTTSFGASMLQTVA